MPIRPTVQDGECLSSIAFQYGSFVSTIASEGGREERCTRMLGHLNPIEDTSSVNARLRDLGSFAGEIDETADDALAGAIAAFQSHHGLQDGGESDQATRNQRAPEPGGGDMRCCSWGPG